MVTLSLAISSANSDQTLWGGLCNNLNLGENQAGYGKLSADCMKYTFFKKKIKKGGVF
jgi:hypothetical protein